MIIINSSFFIFSRSPFGWQSNTNMRGRRWWWGRRRRGTAVVGLGKVGAANAGVAKAGAVG